MIIRDCPQKYSLCRNDAAASPLGRGAGGGREAGFYACHALGDAEGCAFIVSGWCFICFFGGWRGAGFFNI